MRHTASGIVQTPGYQKLMILLGVLLLLSLTAHADTPADFDTGTASLPVNIAQCETDPISGVCINPVVPSFDPVTTTIGADETPTFAFFVMGTDMVPFDAANNRIFVRFRDISDVVRGATSVAVRTQ